MGKSFNRKIIIGVVIVLAALCLLQSLYYVNIYLEKKTNHERVVKLIDNDLLFSWDTMDDELIRIINWIDSDYFENGDLGRLYERASLIYMQKGETMSYYRFLGYALYYLEQSDDKDYTVNIYLDLANFFLNNYDMASAKKMIDTAIEIEDFDAIENLQVKSYAYRMLGVMAIQDEDYEKAELNTLLTILNKYPPDNPEIRATLYEILDRLYTKLFNSQNITYTGVIDSMVTDSKKEMINAAIYRQKIKERNQLIFVASILIGLFLLFCFVKVLNGRYDGLTQLLNRKIFNRHLNRYRRSNQKYGVIMMDIDDFKGVNDTYGHLEGDIVLQRLGQILLIEVKTDVQCYRYGGEEFVVIVGKNSLPLIEKLAERIRASMEQQSWEFDENIRITLSLGVATGKGEDEVLRLADDNLYASKQQGKNRVTVSHAAL